MPKNRTDPAGASPRIWQTHATLHEGCDETRAGDARGCAWRRTAASPGDATASKKTPMESVLDTSPRDGTGSREYLKGFRAVIGLLNVTCCFVAPERG